MKAIAFAAAITFSACGLAASALAQNAAAPAAADTSGVSDAEVQAVAVLKPQVTKLLTDTQSASAGADDATKAAMINQMYDQLRAMLQSKGLTIERYNEIATLAQNNPALNQRIDDASQPADGAPQGTQ